MRRFLGLLAAVVAFVSFGTAAAAASSDFAVEGPKWSVNANTSFSFLTPACGSDHGAGNGVATPVTTCYISFRYSSGVVSRGWAGAIRGAANNWCNKPDPYSGLSQDFCYEDYTYNPCSVNCNQVAVGAMDLGGRKPDGSLPAGVTEISVSDSATNEFTHVNIYMNTNSAENWYVPNGQPIVSSQSDLTSFTMHELGHALGLDHPSRGPDLVGPVMNCVLFTGTHYSGVTSDFNGMRWLYDGNNAAYGSPVSSPC